MPRCTLAIVSRSPAHHTAPHFFPFALHNMLFNPLHTASRRFAPLHITGLNVLVQGAGHSASHLSARISAFFDW